MKMSHIFVSILLIGVICLALAETEQSEPSAGGTTLQCAYHSDNSTDMDELPFIIRQEGHVVTCSNQTFCFTVWKVDENGLNLISGQSCMDKNTNTACAQSKCVADGSKELQGGNRYCCCSGNMCNLNLSIVDSFENATIAPAHAVMPAMSPLMIIWHSPIVWLCGSIAVLLILAAILIFCYGVPNKPEPELAPLAPSGPGYSSNLRNVDNLKLCAMIGQGKYGSVWKGLINEQTVAVKIFPSHHKQFFLNEKDIYSVNLLESPHILEYYGCDERRTLDDSIEYLLVLSLAPLGCLQDWLKENTTTFSAFICMAKSVARGLAHLHTEAIQGSLRKPCICHRDLNSRNVLVKADLTCVVADFGFAMKTFGPRYEWKGELILAETKSYNDVGTIRYLAPEVLEGAVNLRDCESSLKQVDVYALGLILWELCTRCHDWYPQGQTVPNYSLPYESEVGKKPSYEQMQTLVARHKARPAFPLGWGGGPAAKLARETCEDCWDHDAEARLTSLCAEERIHEMSNLPPRTRHHNASSPPLNTNNLISSGTMAHNSELDAANTANRRVVGILKSANRQRYADGTDPAVLNLVSPTSLKNREIFSQQIQPFQGRNPCMERNLMPNSPQSPSLIDKSQKHSFIANNNDLAMSRLEDDVSVEDLISNHLRNGDNAQNILGEGIPKQNNADRILTGWYGVRALIHKKLFRRHPYSIHDDEKLSNVEKGNRLAMHVNIDANNELSTVRYRNSEPAVRPSNLNIMPKINVDRPRKMTNSNVTRHTLPSAANHEQFTSANERSRIVTSKSATAVRSLNNFEMFDEHNLKRQRSLEVFRDVFGTKGSIERLRDPSQRVKTPGDVPPSVRKVRASKTLSLYDDRMMDLSTNGNVL